MKDIIEILKEQGIELQDDKAKAVTKAVAEEYKTVKEYRNTVAKLEGERDSYKQQLETAKEALQEFDGVDVNDMKEKMADYEKKMKEQEEDYKKQLYDRDFSDALTSAMESYQFTSEYAKQAVMDEIKAAELKLVDGKIIGLNDMIEAIKGKDASAFVDEKQQALEGKKARFTNPLQTRKDGEKISPSELMKMKNENPDLDISQYM